jgi:putative hydrolase of the HAD superfamily
MPPCKPLRAVLFDVGGTLIVENPRRHEIYAEAARARGIDLEPREMRKLMQATAASLPRVTEDGHFRYSEAWFRGFIERLFVARLGLGRERLDELTEELLARFRDPRSFRVFPHTRELLERLRGRDLILGIVSNWSEALPGLLQRLGILERVDFCLVSALERAEKPEPELFLRALDRAGSRPGETVHAGNDFALDVRGALACGILPVLVDHGHRAGGPPGVARVGGLDELEGWILERTR